MTINERMFRIMEDKNIKMIDLAEYLNISKSVVSTWKKRGNNPPAEYIERICELLEVKIEYFITGKQYDNLTENEKELLENFKVLPEREQVKFIGKLEDVAMQYKQGQEKSSNSKIG